jgi:hypothetical protein
VLVVVIVALATDLCRLRSVGLQICATGKYALWVVLGSACFNQSLVGRLTWPEWSSVRRFTSFNLFL